MRKNKGKIVKEWLDDYSIEVNIVLTRVHIDCLMELIEYDKNVVGDDLVSVARNICSMGMNFLSILFLNFLRDYDLTTKESLNVVIEDINKMDKVRYYKTMLMIKYSSLYKTQSKYGELNSLFNYFFGT